MQGNRGNCEGARNCSVGLADSLLLSVVLVFAVICCPSSKNLTFPRNLGSGGFVESEVVAGSGAHSRVN